MKLLIERASKICGEFNPLKVSLQVPTDRSDFSASVTNWLETAANAIDQRAEFINAVNVFPVADSDTANNLVATLRSAVAECRQADSADLTQQLRLAARGAILGAAGNSGLITAAWLAGLSQWVSHSEQTTAHHCADNSHEPELSFETAFVPSVQLAAALHAAARRAHEVVATSAPYSILSVADAVAEAIPADGVLKNLSEVIWGAARATQASPLGVPDAGAWGFALLLDTLNLQLDPGAQSAGRDVEAELIAAAVKRLSHSTDGPQVRLVAGVENVAQPEIDTEIVASWAAEDATVAVRFAAHLRAELNNLQREEADSLVIVHHEADVALHIHVSDDCLHNARSILESVSSAHAVTSRPATITKLLPGG